MARATPQWLTALRVRLVDLRKEQSRLERKLMSPAEMTEGCINIQYRRCGRSGCACMRDADPVKHGPYHYLAVKTSAGLRLRYLKDKALIVRLKHYREYSDLLLRYQKNQREMMAIFREMRRKQSHE